jgi:hypothetical protein
MGATTSTTEAFDLLKSARADLIAAARQRAVEMISTDGPITSRQLFEEMKRRGEYRDVGNDRWLGVVFNDRRFRKTGETVTVEGYDRATSHGPALINQWELAR